MRSYDRLIHPVDKVLGVYFHHCAVAMSCRQLARAGLFLAAGGRDPTTGNSVVRPARARRINALMLTCGLYDASGDFAYRVGLPAKSGVGGGILAVAPGPRLDLRLVAGARRRPATRCSGSSRSRRSCSAPGGRCSGRRGGMVRSRRTRTSTGVSPQRPQRCASTSSATTALAGLLTKARREGKRRNAGWRRRPRRLQAIARSAGRRALTRGNRCRIPVGFL